MMNCVQEKMKEQHKKELKGLEVNNYSAFYNVCCSVDNVRVLKKMNCLRILDQ